MFSIRFKSEKAAGHRLPPALYKGANESEITLFRFQFSADF
jgi:hypothetical protein